MDEDHVNHNIIRQYQHHATEYQLAIYVSILYNNTKLYYEKYLKYLPSTIRLIVVFNFNVCCPRESPVGGISHESDKSLTSGGREVC